MSGLSSPLILKYHKTLEGNPRSRVFAPLAESYRKLGHVDRALEILKSGLRHHPTYILGHLGLAYCYFDIQENNLAYTTLKPFINDNKDNLRLMKLFAKICLNINAKAEALDAFKYLLFLNPRDRDVATNVKTLEEDINQSSVKINFSRDDGTVESFEASTGFNVKELKSHPIKEADVDEWVQIDFQAEDDSEDLENEIDQWSLKQNEVLPEEEKDSENSNEIRAFKLEVKEDNKPFTKSSFESDDSPVITHTLVDLYCKQGHIEKACEILENILALNPHDEKTKEKLREVMSLLPDIDAETAEVQSVEEETYELTEHNVLPFEQSEEESREHLMSFFIEEKESSNISKGVDLKAVETKLWAFNEKIRQRASEHLDHRV